MPLITFFINRILEKEKIDKNLILSYQCLNTLENLDNDVKSYYHLYLNDILDHGENLIGYYIRAKKMSNAFTKLQRIWKWKKAIKYDWNTDLCMVYDLDDLPKHKVVAILSNNTIYKFRISDIINIWSESLVHREGLFASPQNPKNPHTNTPFKIHNLYNLYLAICDSRFHIPLPIGAIFKCLFVLYKFKQKYFPLLRERIIALYYKDASDYEIYEYIHTMLDKLRAEIGSVYLSSMPTRAEKQLIIVKMRRFVFLYLKMTLSCNPGIRNVSREILIEKLNAFIDDVSNEALVYRVRSRTTRIESNGQLQYPLTTSPLHLAPPPVTLPIQPFLPPIPTSIRTPILTNTLSHISNRIGRTATIQSRFRTRLTSLEIDGESDVFMSRPAIPRTPNRIQVPRNSNTSMRNRFTFPR
jgi:hypothetical protein